jgi:hypothetical protein
MPETIEAVSAKISAAAKAAGATAKVVKGVINSCYAKMPLSPMLKTDSNSIDFFNDAR